MTDQECRHCGRYFSSHGIQNHEANCPVKQEDSIWFDGEKLVTQRCSECGAWQKEDTAVHKAGCPDSLWERLRKGELEEEPEEVEVGVLGPLDSARVAVGLL